MALPDSRNTTFAPLSPVPSQDLNALQDMAIGIHRCASWIVRPVSSGLVADDGSFFALDAATDESSGDEFGSVSLAGGTGVSIFDEVNRRALWRVDVQMIIEHAGTSNPQRGTVEIVTRRIVSASPEVIAQPQPARGVRYSASAGAEMHIHGWALVDLGGEDPDEGSYHIAFRPLVGAGDMTVLSGFVSLERHGRRSAYTTGGAWPLPAP